MVKIDNVISFGFNMKFKKREHGKIYVETEKRNWVAA